MVWAFSTDIVYFRFASHKLEKTGALHGFGMSYVTRSQLIPRCLSARTYTCCLWYSPMDLRIRYARRSKTCPASYNLCHKSLVPDWYTSLFANISYFWKGKLSTRFTCHYLAAATSFEYFFFYLKRGV